MSVLRELGREIAAEQDRRLVAIDAKRMADRFRQASEQSTRDSTRWRWPFAIAAALAVGVVSVFLVTTKTRQPLAFQVGGATEPGVEATWIAASDTPVPIRFSDGSRLVLEAGARARVRRVMKSGAELDVEQGRVGVSIVPHQGNLWRLALGPFTVEVTGTRFDIEWNPETQQLKLMMHEGKINVSGCEVATRPLAAGEVLKVSCRDKTVEVSPLLRHDDATLQEDEKSPAAPNLGDPAVVARRSSRSDAKGDSRADTGDAKSGSPSNGKWRALTEAGRYREALAAADAAGFESECRRASVADLLSLAATARLAGDGSKARQAYMILRTRFGTDPAASLAAFHLARIEFDMMSNYSAAARWFETYLREDPSGSLAPEAYGRRLEALKRAGDTNAARQAASEYLSRYPSGHHAEFARRLAR